MNLINSLVEKLLDYFYSGRKTSETFKKILFFLGIHKLHNYRCMNTLRNNPTQQMLNSSFFFKQISKE